MSSRASRPRSRRHLVGVSAVAMGALLTTYAGALRSLTYARAVTPATASCSPGATLVSDDTQLQTAVTASVDGAIICVTADITVSQTLTIDDTTLTLEGATPATQLSGGGVRRILLADFRTGADDTLTLRNLTFTQGSSLNADDSDGGAIAVLGSSRLDTFSAEDVTIKDSYSFEDGGGIALSSMDSIRFTRSKFYDDSAANDSGAVEINFANRVIIEQSVFKRNTAVAEDGGAVSLQDALDVRITGNSVFERNQAGRDGGSLQLFNGSNYLLVQNATFTDDSTGVDGGSLYIRDVAEVQMSQIQFTGASANDDGGALYLRDASVISISNSTFSDNQSGDYGGAGFVRGSDDTVTMTNVTLNDNATGVSGGGLYLSDLSGPVQLTTITARSNQAGSSGGFLRGSGLSGATVTINGLDSQGNTANADGGSIKQTSGALQIFNSTFTSNMAGDDGGAIYVYEDDDTVVLVNSVLRSNSAANSGGGLHVEGNVDGIVSIESSRFERNSAVSRAGGGLYVDDMDSVIIRNSTFVDDTAGGQGGAGFFVRIYTSVDIEGSTFSGNQASAGGAIVASQRFATGTMARQGAPLSVVNSTFVGNSSDDTSGAIWLRGENHTLDFVTVSGNSSGFGGGVSMDDTASLVVTNSIIAGNSAINSGADVSVSANSTLDDSYSLFTSADAVSGATVDGPGTIFGAPKLNGLADNGGPTSTMLPQWDSPAFQAGNPNWVAPPANDQRGTGFPRDAGGRVSMGAIQGRSARPIDPVFPPSAPREVEAVAGDAQAVVSWEAPASTGSFPVTNYQIDDSTGEISVLVQVTADDPLSIVIEELVNGREYAFRVRALNGAGWGAWSDYSDPVIPQPGPSIVITGTRDGRYARVVGETTGLVGTRMVPRIRFPGAEAYRDGVSRPVVDAEGVFTWQRQGTKKTYVYFFTEDRQLRSNRVIIRAKN